MPMWELTLRLLTPSDWIIRLNMKCSWLSTIGFAQTSLISFPRTSPLFFKFKLVWVGVCSLYPNVPSGTGIGQNSVFLSRPHNKSVSLHSQLLNALSPHPTLKPRVSGIHGSLVCSFPNSHMTGVIPRALFFPVRALLWALFPVWCDDQSINEHLRWDATIDTGSNNCPLNPHL